MELKKEQEGTKQEKFSNYIRQFYNHKVTKVCKEDYEYFRWFSTSIKRRQFKFTTQSLLFHLRDIDFTNCLEIGCGPGTWTRLLLKKYPDAEFTCLDISKQMITQFKQKTKNNKINFLVNNFLDQEFNKKYDFIFCSRAIEYIPNKSEVIRKIYNLLQEQGKGIIVTSPPHPKALFIKKMIGKKINLQHTQRISVKKMNYLLKKTGFKNIKFYPILFSDFSLVPTSLLFRNFYQKKWGLASKMFATGYIVKFEKPKNETN